MRESQVQQHLDERTAEVLRSVVEIHVATGEPVGSESLARALNRTLSPATIRNVMAELERLGLLGHPHTSAGRLPTDDGYRVFVDSLMGPATLPPKDAAAVESELRAGDASPQQVMENASALLSRLSRHVGFVLAPDIARATFMHVDLVRLPPPRILVVMVARTGFVTNKVIEVEDEMTQDELQACANYLNLHFAGLSLSSIRSRLLELMKEEKALYDSLLKRVIAVGERAFDQSQDGGDVYIEGRSNIFTQPEFGEDLERMRNLFRTFEEKSRLVKILNACITGEGVRILIGHENPDPGLRDVALVTAGYPIHGDAGFGVGVLGATRMEYAKVIALVDHVARSLSQALAELRT